jgi:hypothetical protein
MHSKFPYPLHGFKRDICRLIILHTRFPLVKQLRPMGTRPETLEGKVSVHLIGYNTFYEEHGASSRKLSLLGSLPSSHVDESTFHAFYIPDHQELKTNMQIQIPHFDMIHASFANI